jgi:hypothetical protein
MRGIAIAQFFEAWYTPQLMCLVVRGAGPLDETQAAVEASFGAVPLRAPHASAPEYASAGCPFDAREMGVLYKVRVCPPSIHRGGPCREWSQVTLDARGTLAGRAGEGRAHHPSHVGAAARRGSLPQQAGRVRVAPARTRGCGERSRRAEAARHCYEPRGRHIRCACSCAA